MFTLPLLFPVFRFLPAGDSSCLHLDVDYTMHNVVLCRYSAMNDDGACMADSVGRQPVCAKSVECRL